uniref:Uncharacterized protein n=1 Tax=Nelumbo nucifera TaxID=4432 RepID=A0A822XVK9_NELNU|nr:TPA_asm: hypothetical protein HUJ06_024664 [Nelumbo nucifera]
MKSISGYYTLEKGFCPIVFESRGRISGVWTQTLETTKVQTLKLTYEFSDFHGHLL